MAKELLKYITKYAEDNHYNSIFLNCLETAYGAHKLYESIGFKRMSSIKYTLSL